MIGIGIIGAVDLIKGRWGRGWVGGGGRGGRGRRGGSGSRGWGGGVILGWAWAYNHLAIMVYNALYGEG